MLYGYLARFPSQEALVQAIKALKEGGYRRFEVFLPNPVEEVEGLLGKDERIPWIAFFLGVLGAGLGLFLQVVTQLDYVINVSGKPLLGWPAYIPITFEVTILTITVGIFLVLLYLNGLPQSAHPVRLAQGYPDLLVDHYGVLVYVSDPLFHADKTREVLEALGAEVEEVRRG